MSTGYYPFKNLVFEGGGVKGVAYAGVIEVLEPAAILPQIVSVAGTSAGAITATLVSLNYNADEVVQIMMETDFSKFEDGSDLGGPVRFIEDYGWFKGDYFLHLMEGYIAKKTGSKATTFGELRSLQSPAGPPFKELYVFGTNLSRQRWQEFSHRTTPDMKIADAVRISMSIPFFFEARSHEGDVYCDGGVLYNYPIDFFDPTSNGYRTPTRETLGFHFFNPGGTTPPINDVRRFTGGVMDAILDLQDIQLQANPGDESRTVFIDTLGVSFTDFHLSDETKLALIAQGRTATADYFKQFVPQTFPDIKRPVRRT